MFMKVHPKGQIVIPAEVRKRLGIEVGDLLEVEIDPDHGRIELRCPSPDQAGSLAGSLRAYARGKRFPSKRQMADALRKGLTGG
jgi:AbrB family looped-hinge helix DNA binding protein